MSERTVRVRIAVAMQWDGERWYAYGHSAGDDEDSRNEAMGDIYGGNVVWIEADVPLPSEAVIQGEVSGE